MPATTTSAPEVQFLASRARVLTGAQEGDGRLGLVDMLEMPPGDMPPLHVHRAEDEGFYVLSGQVTVFHPGEEVVLGPGEFALTPKDTPHTYRVGDAPARALVFSTPAGFDRFVAAVAALDVVTPERLTAVAADHDIEILGPPGMLP